MQTRSLWLITATGCGETNFIVCKGWITGIIGNPYHKVNDRPARTQVLVPYPLGRAWPACWLADGVQFDWRWNGGTISLILGVIWGTPVEVM